MFRKVFTIFVICAVFSASFQQTPPAPAPAPVIVPSCSTTDSANLNKNALEYLKSKGVEILSAIEKTTDTSICNGMFNTAGTCCKIDSVKSFVKNQNEKIVEKWGKYISKLGKIRSKLWGAVKKMSSEFEDTLMKKKMDILTKIGANAEKFKLLNQMIPATAAQTTALKNFVDTFEKEIENFKVNGKQCFDTMRKVRANLLCGMCVADAGKYSEGQSTTQINFKINLDDCKSIVDPCYNVWKFNFFLTTTLQYLNSLKEAKKGENAETKFKPEVNIGEKLAEIKETLGLCSVTGTPAKLTCTTPAGSSLTVDDHYKRLCKIVITINKDNNLFEGDEKCDNDMDDKDADEAEKEAKKDKMALTPVTPVAPVPVTPPTVKRVLQAAATEPTVGVDIASNTNSAVPNLNSDNSGMVPTQGVDTSKAGDTSFGKIISTGLISVLMFFMILVR